jgi:archaellum component FlaG (FlaF/FlaG flagellin family)
MRYKFKLFALLLLAVVVATFIVYGSLLSWSSSVTVNVSSPSIGVYWDANCTNPVTTINLGNLQQGTQDWRVTLYVKNNAQGSVKLWWNSTRALISDKIIDMWVNLGLFDLNGITIGPGQVLTTYYRIWVRTDCPPGSYSWTLNLGVTD